MENIEQCSRCDDLSDQLIYTKKRLEEHRNELVDYIKMCAARERDLKILCDNCDPFNMTKEDCLIWSKWDQIFHPENYDNIS